MEVLVAVVDDGAVLAAGPDVANTLYDGDTNQINGLRDNRLYLEILDTEFKADR